MKSYLQGFLCFSFFLLTANIAPAQTVTDPSANNPGYEAAKLAAAQSVNHTGGVLSNAPVAGASVTTISNNCYGGPVAAIPVPRNDDGSFGPIALPFTYSFFGMPYNQVWINTNGTISFTGPFPAFTASSFPINDPVLAPFWADFDTRPLSSGAIYYRLSATNLVVTWDGVGYFSGHTEKLNTFQVVITNGTDPILPNANTAFYYGDMQWTTGDANGGFSGFGGNPASVGLNRGLPDMAVPFYIQIGRFDNNTSNYDGAGGFNDGVNYLDNKCFLFDGRRNCGIEICNGVDDDCDDLVDEGCIPNAFYRDVDHDGYGNSNIFVIAPSAPPGYVAVNGDCDDWDASIHPGAVEICNFRDDNCNGIIDEGCHVYYRDADGDGYGLWDQQVRATTQPAGYSTIGGDCHDWDPSIHPGAIEICNFKDDDCNGIVDDGCAVYYRDADGDGYGLWDQQVRAMTRPAGYSPIGGDCNDLNAAVHPGATELCNTRDDNCNGLVDESCTFMVVPDGSRSQTVSEKVTNVLSAFNIAANPNPSNHAFTLSLQGDYSKGKIIVRVYDYMGRLVEMKDNLAAGQTIKLGASYKKGAYIVEAAQGSNRKTIKLVKL